LPKSTATTDGERKLDEILFLQHRLLCCTADGKNQTKTPAAPEAWEKKRSKEKHKSKEIRRERRAVACLRSDPTLAPRYLRHCDQPWEACLPSRFRIVAACVRASYYVSVLSVCSLKSTERCKTTAECGLEMPI
jgi:hypothetical protein